MAAYCTVDDLLIGDVPLPDYIDPGKYIQDAADEIDSMIGFLYETPIDVTNVTLARPVVLLLKRINVYLASGRLLLSLDAGSEEQRPNAYGLWLVQQAMAAIQSITSGDIDLTDVPHIDTGDPDTTGPQIANVDIESNVEAFYDRIANPNYSYDAYPYGTGSGVVIP